MENGKIYWSREVATLLGIGDSTLRKWCLELEKAGYAFVRDENDKRAFFDKDVLALRDMQILIRKGITLENAAISIQTRLKQKEQAAIVLSGLEDNSRSDQAFNQTDLIAKNDFLEYQQAFFEQLELQLLPKVRNEIKQELELKFEEKITRLERLLQDSVERRDALLMDTLRKMQEETQRQIAAAQETKKKRFWGLF